MARDIKATLLVDGEKQFKDALSEAMQSVRTLGSELKLAAAEFKNNNDAQEYTRKTSEILRKEIEQQKETIRALEQAVEDSGKKWGEGSKKQEEYQEKLNKAKTALANMEGELTNVENGLDRNGKALSETTQETEKADNATEKLADTMGKKLVADACKTVEQALKTVVSAVKDAFNAFMDFVREASEYETAFAKVRTIADSTSDAYGTLSKDIIELSNATGIAATEIADSVYNAISGGVDTANAVEMVQRATQLAAGGFTDTTTAIDILTTALNAYGLEATEASRISDMLITTQNLGKTTVGDLATNMGRVIPIAAAFGVQLEEVNTAYALMTAGGINTANSTTYLAAMLQELGKDGSSVAAVLEEQTRPSLEDLKASGTTLQQALKELGPEAQAQFEKLRKEGKSTEEAWHEVAVGTGQNFAELMESGMTLDQVMQMLLESVNGDTVAFQNLWGSQTAGLAALALLNAGSEKYNATLQAMQESTGATADAYSTMADTFQTKQNILEQRWANAKIQIYESLQEPLKSVMDTLIDLITRVTDWMASDEAKVYLDEIGEAIKSLAQFLADNMEPIIEAIIGAIRTALQVIQWVIEHADLLKTVLIAVTAVIVALEAAQLALNVAMLASNPVVLGITAAIGALIAIIAVCIEHWDDIKRAAAAAWEGIKSAWNGAVEWFKNIWAGIENAFSAVGSFFSNAFTSAWEGIKSAWAGVKGWFSDLWTGITDIFSSVDNWMSDKFGSAWDAIKQAFQPFVDYFQTLWDTVKGIFEVVKDVLSGDFEGAWEAIKGVFASWGDFFHGLWDTITGIFSGIGEWFLGVGRSIIEGIWNGINGAIQWLKDKVTGFASGFVGFFKDLFGIHSPSTVFRDQIGLNIGEGIGEGILDSVPTVQQAMADMMDSIMPDLSGSSTVTYGTMGLTAAAIDSIGAAVGRNVPLDDRPIVIQIGGREFGRAVREYA